MLISPYNTPNNTETEPKANNSFTDLFPQEAN